MTAKMEKYNCPELDKVCLSFHYTEPFVMDGNLWAWHLDDTVPRKVEELYLVNFFNEGISAARKRNRRFQRGVIGVLYISFFALVAYGWHTHSLSFMGFLYQALPAEHHRLITLTRIIMGVVFGLSVLTLLARLAWLKSTLSDQHFRTELMRLLVFINSFLVINVFSFYLFSFSVST